MFQDFSDSSQDPDFAQVWELSLNTFPLPQACGFNCESFFLGGVYLYRLSHCQVITKEQGVKG